MKEWLKAYAVGIWYVAAESITAAVLSILYILWSGQDVQSQTAQTVANTTFAATIIAAVITLLPFLPRQIKESTIAGKITWKRMAFLISLGITLNALTMLTIKYLPFGEELVNYNDAMTLFHDANCWISIFSAVVVTPIVEEYLFRYKIGRFFEHQKKWYRIFATAIVFGCMHINLCQAVYGFVLGLVIGKIYEDDKNLTDVILLHSAINASTCALYMLDGRWKITCTVIVVIAAVYCCLCIVCKVSQRKKQRMVEKNE